MAENKLGAQCQVAGEDIYRFNSEAQPNNIKTVNINDAGFWQRIWAENPRLKYAIYRECADQPEPWNDPEGTAITWIAKLKSKIGHLVDAGLITHVEGYNEWIHAFHTEHFLPADRFMLALIDECHVQFEGKLHAIILNASCGHFSDDILNFPLTLAKLNEGCGCMLGLHEYDRENMDRLHLEDLAKGGDGFWLCGKFKRVEQALKGAGYNDVPIALTEVGLDDAVDRPMGSHHWGWEHYGATIEEAATHYLNEHNLSWYAPLLYDSDMVKLASIFGCEMYYEDNWGAWGFDIKRGFPILLEGIKDLEGAEPPPPEPNGGEDMDLGKVKVFAIDADTGEMVELINLEDKEALVFDKYGVAFRRAEVAPGEKVYRLTELWEKSGPASLLTQVLNEDSSPIADMDVAFYWSDAPDPPDPPTEVYAHDWYGKFVHGPTNVNGDVGPGMGPGAYHGRGEGGPHAVWVRDPNIASDICEKLGMLAGTPHDHLDQKFQLMAQENGEENGELVYDGVVREDNHPHSMLGIAVPIDYSVEHDVRGDGRGPGVDDTIHPIGWVHPTEGDMALVEVCADYNGEEGEIREFTIQVLSLSSGAYLTEKHSHSFGPLGTPRERIIHVYTLGGEPPPSDPRSAKDVLDDLEGAIAEFKTVVDNITIDTSALVGLVEELKRLIYL